MRYNPFGDTTSTYSPAPVKKSKRGSWLKTMAVLIPAVLIMGVFVYYSSLSKQRDEAEKSVQDAYSTMYTIHQSLKSDDVIKYVDDAQNWLLEGVPEKEAENTRETIEKTKTAPSELSLDVENKEFGANFEPYVSVCVLILTDALAEDPPKTVVNLCNELDEKIQTMSTLSVRYNESLSMFTEDVPFFEPLPLLKD